MLQISKEAYLMITKMVIICKDPKKDHQIGDLSGLDIVRIGD